MKNPINIWRTLEGNGVVPWRGAYYDDRNPGDRCALGWLWGEAEVDDEKEREIFQEHGLHFNLHPTYICPLCMKALSIPHLNDDHKMSFGQLADFCEEHPELIFLPEAIEEFGLSTTGD